MLWKVIAIGDQHRRAAGILLHRLLVGLPPSTPPPSSTPLQRLANRLNRGGDAIGPRLGGGSGTLPPLYLAQQELSALRRFRGGSIPINS